MSPAAARSARTRKPVVPYGNVVSSENARGQDDIYEDDEESDDAYDGEYRETKRRRDGSTDDEEEGEERKVSSRFLSVRTRDSQADNQRQGVKKDKSQAESRRDGKAKEGKRAKSDAKVVEVKKKVAPAIKPGPMRKKLDILIASKSQPKPKHKARSAIKSQPRSDDEVEEDEEEVESQERNVEGSRENEMNDPEDEVTRSPVGDGAVKRSPSGMSETTEPDQPSPSLKQASKAKGLKTEQKKKSKQDITEESVHESDEESDVERQIDETNPSKSKNTAVPRGKAQSKRVITPAAMPAMIPGAPRKMIASKRVVPLIKPKFTGLQPVAKTMTKPASSGGRKMSMVKSEPKKVAKAEDSEGDDEDEEY